MSVYCFKVDILGRPSCVTDSVCKPGCEVRTCRHAAGNQRSCAATLNSVYIAAIIMMLITILLMYEQIKVNLIEKS